MVIYRRTAAVLVLALSACSATVPPAQAPVPAPSAAIPAVTGAAASPAAAAALITPGSVRAHVDFLASDELRGRDTPSPGLERAAEYLVDRLRALGLRPAGDSDSFIQRFPLEDVRMDVAGLRVEARHHGTLTRAVFGDDVFVLPSAVDSVVGIPVFAGMARPGFMPQGDVTGRIVVVFVPDTMSQAWQVAVSSSLQAAHGGGAAAVILVLDPAFSAARIGQLANDLDSNVGPLPVIGMRYEVARGVFQHAGLDLAAIRHRTEGAPTELQGVTMLLRTPISTSSAMVPNVVAVLEGSDPARRNEYVVYSAHFDHVGAGSPDATGDSIYNGADDNASGTSAVLEAARAFAALQSRPARSVMFVLVSGEEKGLLGSMYFVQNPPVPVLQMVANINADMVGRNAPDTIVAIGQDYSSLGATAQSVAGRHPEIGLLVAPDLWPQEQLFFRSDHFSFAAQEVPAIFFTSGLHEDYHRPSDQAHLLDHDKVSRVSRLMFYLGHEIATAAERPQWTPEGLEAVRRATGGR
ncbi:M28 family metallopeptidase [soil metagenome]